MKLMASAGGPIAEQAAMREVLRSAKGEVEARDR